jgi:hypothetical protein
MPTRLLRDWTDSFAVDALDAHAERFFVRLIMVVDDYGRFHADPRILRSKCFPLKTDVRDTDITRWTAACMKSGLLRCYQDGKSRSLLEIQGFKQRARTPSKYPSPDICQSIDGQMTALGEGVCEDAGVSPKPPKGASGPTDLQVRIGKLLNRRETTTWSKKEIAALKDIGEPHEDDLKLLEDFYFAVIPKDRDFRRTSLQTLLNNWNGEIDKARFHRMETQA